MNVTIKARTWEDYGWSTPVSVSFKAESLDKAVREFAKRYEGSSHHVRILALGGGGKTLEVVVKNGRIVKE